MVKSAGGGGLRALRQKMVAGTQCDVSHREIVNKFHYCCCPYADTMANDDDELSRGESMAQQKRTI